ncbi:hypothetical protein V8E52_012017 [Russula decolorans]
MSSGDPSALPSTQSKLEKAIQESYESLEANFKPEHDHNRIKNNLCDVVSKAGDPKLTERFRDLSQFKIKVKSGSKEERELIDLLHSMAKRDVPWSDLFEYEAFFKPESEKKTDLTTAHATEHAWSGEYKGDLADVLCETIVDYLSKDKTPYARLTTVVNSSGTGKSRMVDQLGTEIITVPMCLRQGRREGFPPLDADLRDWLVSDSDDDRGTVQKKLHGFIYSLLMVTREKLETIAKKQDISELPRLSEEAAEERYGEEPMKCVSWVEDRQKKLASAFREHMAKDQLYLTSSPNRRAFYARVIAMAKQFVENNEPVGDGKEPGHGRYVSEHEGLTVAEAGKALCRFIDKHRFLDPEKGPRRPLVVLAFDEADALTDNPPNNDWNLFSELRRVLRQIIDLPIFSLFLSTAGRFDKFSPVIRYDPSAGSARAREPDNRPLDPISEISFDDIAYPASKGTITIHKVVAIDWISHLGRPLFGSYWDNLPQNFKNEIAVMDYAKQKLLNGPSELRNGNWAGSLACLSIRFALEFNMDGTARDVTFAQVERHMRLCIAATAGLENMITIPGSEPLLAEAAYELMKGTHTNAVRHLAGHPDLNCIDRGRRGELVAALLIMQAYDAARAKGKIWVSMVNFMEVLLPPSKFNNLLQSEPTSWPMDYDHHTTFGEIFEEYGMWFNHVIKIERKEMISIVHLWKFVVRGAMILCATNQEGIDIVLPVFHVKQNLGPDSVTAIIIQVKNAKDSTATLQGELFSRMDAVVKSVIFSEPGVVSDSVSESTSMEPMKKKRKVALNLKPVIRIVFALASPEPAIVFRDRPKKRHHFDGFTAFDIWLAGLSDKAYRQIEDEDLVHYQTLLERSLVPHDAFELKDVPHIGEEAKKSRGARRRKMVPLIFPEHAHHSIH